MKKILISIFLLNTIVISAQNNSISVKDHMFKINILTSPGIEYEVGLGKNTTIDFRLGTGFAYVSKNGNGEYGIFPSVEVAYRYYYNFERRIQKGKNTLKNSANYIALSTLFTHGDPVIGDIEVNIDYYAIIAPVWGFQRTYNSNFNWGLELGLGYGFNNEESFLRPVIGFRLGWVLGR
ncbi:hypothetical protein ATE84_1895 [Aquimarina sp. MAR_2010_214]|uniref:hypothetical protein n=1 Tax=Aquimarina sp. MAR_2010_214 TaxID=1250026 RepID=UPI000C70F045|nr:hypothetical protein [Aquimarina sp. MAR_2010_214]PKV49857.1 hypothetical protein ATE84_1895 [Aquimarina sp. MAR_2010_214]